MAGVFVFPGKTFKVDQITTDEVIGKTTQKVFLSDADVVNADLGTATADQIVLRSEPTSSAQCATKKYVDDSIAAIPPPSHAIAIFTGYSNSQNFDTTSAPVVITTQVASPDFTLNELNGEFTCLRTGTYLIEAFVFTGIHATSYLDIAKKDGTTWNIVGFGICEVPLENKITEVKVSCPLSAGEVVAFVCWPDGAITFAGDGIYQITRLV